jgi:hypothetical protein
MAEAQRPECPPWCRDHSAAGLHRSAHDRIRLGPAGRPERGFLAAYALALTDVDAPESRVSLSAVLWDEPADVYIPVATPEAAGQYAMLVERLALATPKQHRELAAQIRKAAAAAFGEAETGDGA